MSVGRRWLEELPADSAERTLLLAVKSEEPLPMVVDHGWQTLSATLGIASATTLVSTQAAATATAASTATAVTAVKAVGFSLLAKSIAVGFAVGVGLLGTSQAVRYAAKRSQHSRQVALVTQPQSSPARAPTTLGLSSAAAGVVPVHSAGFLPTSPQVAKRSDPTSPPLPAAPDVPVAQVPGNTAQAVVGAGTESTPSSSASGRLLSTTTVGVTHAGTLDSKTKPSPESQEVSLADQARELAQVKRLVDAGALGEALRRLGSSYVHDGDSALSEERDALYIEALSKSQHADEAKRRARQFAKRYPSSPHLEKMRRLIGAE